MCCRMDWGQLPRLVGLGVIGKGIRIGGGEALYALTFHCVSEGCLKDTGEFEIAWWMYSRMGWSYCQG